MIIDTNYQYTAVKNLLSKIILTHNMQPCGHYQLGATVHNGVLNVRHVRSISHNCPLDTRMVSERKYACHNVSRKYSSSQQLYHHTSQQSRLTMEQQRCNISTYKLHSQYYT